VIAISATAHEVNDLYNVPIAQRPRRIGIAVAENQPIVLDDDEAGIDSQ